MLRFITGLTIGMVLGFQAIKHAGKLYEACDRCLEYFHSEAHREENG